MVKMENGLPETNTAEEAGSAHQPNLDQDKHDKWLASRTREQMSLTAVLEPPMFGVMEPQTGS